MSSQNTHIGSFTLTLAFVAGCCDAATFAAGHGLFSAHMTGNLVVFAMSLANHGFSHDALEKIGTIPLFILVSVVCGRLVNRKNWHHLILLIEALLLLSAGIAAMLLHYHDTTSMLSYYIPVLIAVMAMGVQNAYGRIFSGDVFGSTTTMTGNIISGAVNFGQLRYVSGQDRANSRNSIQRALIVAIGFLTGCIIGVMTANWVGLAALVLPGLIILVCYIVTVKMHGQPRDLRNSSASATAANAISLTR